MARCPRLAVLLSPFVIVLALAGNVLAQTAPQLTAAVSRKTHGSNDFDIALPLTGGSGIECRAVDNAFGGMKVVLLFDKPVDAGTAAVTAGAATVNGAPAFSGNAMTVLLSDVANAQELTITATGVTSAGGPAGSAAVNVRTLLGDVNSNGSISAADVSLAKGRVGFAVDAMTYRADVNFNFSVSGADVNLVKNAVGTSVAGGATANTAPTISDMPNQTGESGAASLPIAVAVADAESAPTSLGLTATSSNAALIPASGLVFGGSGANRTLTITPAAGGTGTATITVNVSDSLLSASDTFDIIVTAPTKLFIAQMRPQVGALTQASGSSTLRLAGDEMSASVRYNFSNLGSPKVAAHVHGPADPGVDGSAGILFDLDIDQQPDGSYLWTFPADAVQRQQMVGWIKGGQTYINVHSSTYPNGEIKGFYALANGSVEFKKPPDPPPLPPGALDPGTMTGNEAARFLIQSTYGPTEAEIANAIQFGVNGWLDDQMTRPPTQMKPILDARVAAGQTLAAVNLFEAWWRVSLTGEDQLRQRVAFALSQIFVISQNSSVLNERYQGVANYYDLLLRDAFGNFRTLLEDVTLSPAMGVYLDMRGNRKGNPATGTIPNENYAREILQLFSIGLNQVHPDGTLKLDQFGLPVPTYDQNVVIGFSRVFTGWDWHQPGTIVSNPPANYIDPMTLIPSRHEVLAMPGQTYSKLLLNGVTLPPNRTGTQDLKDALDNIFNHPNVGPFIARQLIQRLVTSNPSPGYVYRVARAFDGYRGTDPDGSPSAPRGDLAAVVKAILTDYEARSTTFINTPGYGKLREPLLRNTAVIRAFNPTSVSGQWRVSQTDGTLLQTPLRAPTVFNFYEPDYAHPGYIASAGLVSPEFQITSETTTITSANFMRDGIYVGWASATPNRDIKISPTAEQALAGNPTALVERVNQLLMAGQMPQAMKTIIVNHVSTISASDTLGRARAAIHLTATSPQFCTQK